MGARADGGTAGTRGPGTGSRRCHGVGTSESRRAGRALGELESHREDPVGIG